MHFYVNVDFHCISAANNILHQANTQKRPCIHIYTHIHTYIHTYTNMNGEGYVYRYE